MGYDADAVLRALVPPTFTHGGRRYIGRFLSAEEWEPYRGRARAWFLGALDASETRRLALEVADAAFPRTRWERLAAAVLGRLWRRWRPSVAEIIATLTPRMQAEALFDFTCSLGRELVSSPSLNGPAPGTARRGRTTA